MNHFLLHVLMLCGWLATNHAQAQGPVAGAAGEELPAAPVARSNWVVTRAGGQVFAFYGLGPGKNSGDIARDVHAFDLRKRRWRSVGAVPVKQGRLASAAVTVAGTVYLIGGYTVSPEGAEVSTPEVWRFTPSDGRFEVETKMPIPVDDTVAMPWRDRWIILISGWHDTANVADVQIYDTHARRWTSATPWPGRPVFGHAGGLVGDTMVICDGVTASKGTDGKNRFAITDGCWKGQLDPDAIGRIGWHALAAHPGKPLYRAGATGAADDSGKQVVFAGGSPRPYNYNGTGYDGLPAEPSSAVFGFDLDHGDWRTYQPLPVAAMDFRGSIEIDGAFALFGGMRAGQQVSDGIIRFELAPP